MRPLLAVGLTLLLVFSGCVAGLDSGTPEAAGEVVAEATTEPPDDVEPVPLTEIENEYIQRAVERAVRAYEKNETAERVVVPIPEPAFDRTQQAYRKLPETTDESYYGRTVVYRNTTVRVAILTYT